MKNNTVDKLNLLIIIISFYVSIYLPFELFLFSYAVLGPLHYLTEINWLNDKNYFVLAQKKWVLFYVFSAILISIYSLISHFGIKWLDDYKFIGKFTNLLLLLGLFYAIILVFVKKKSQLLLYTGISFISVLITYFFVPNFFIYVGVFLPTLIHVYVFTMLFMIYGVLKKHSIIGVINIIILLAVPFLILNSDIVISQYSPSGFIRQTFSDSNFGRLNVFVANLFDNTSKKSFNLLSETGIKIQIFIAFAYTYHYLNWFSKTSLIGWKKSITSVRIKYILFFWLCSVGLYVYDYKIGLVALFFLSLLHVFLEFPLNIITIKTIITSKKIS